MVRSVRNWQEVIDDKTALQIADFILDDLVGYRKTSLHRADDVDTMTNFINAMLHTKMVDSKGSARG